METLLGMVIIKELRWKIVNYGFDMFIKTGILTWAYDPCSGTPLDWKNRMMKDGIWGDHIFLQLTSNILQVDLVILSLSISFTFLKETLRAPTTRVSGQSQRKMFSKPFCPTIRGTLTTRDPQFYRRWAVRADWSFLMVLSHLISVISRWS